MRKLAFFPNPTSTSTRIVFLLIIVQSCAAVRVHHQALARARTRKAADTRLCEDLRIHAHAVCPATLYGWVQMEGPYSPYGPRPYEQGGGGEPGAHDVVSLGPIQQAAEEVAGVDYESAVPVSSPTRGSESRSYDYGGVNYKDETLNDNGGYAPDYDYHEEENANDEFHRHPLRAGFGSMRLGSHPRPYHYHPLIFPHHRRNSKRRFNGLLNNRRPINDNTVRRFGGNMRPGGLVGSEGRVRRPPRPISEEGRFPEAVGIQFQTLPRPWPRP